MTTNQHTPGPWYCPGINSKYGVFDWKQANITTGNEYAPIIATVYTEDPTYLGEIDHNTMLANARLIASAPDLLAERDQLREINAELLASLDFMVQAADTEPGMSIYRAHIDVARAVIEKAKKG